MLVYIRYYFTQAGFPGFARVGRTLRHFTTLFAHDFDLGPARLIWVKCQFLPKYFDLLDCPESGIEKYQ